VKTLLFFDTETTGLPRNFKAPATDIDNWPRCVQLGWILATDDGRELSRFNSIIRPEGFEIPEMASAVHGISTARALKEGINLIPALYMFKAALAAADVIIGHNVAFDQKIIAAEFFRNDIKNSIEEKSSICTMEATTDYCAIPGKHGFKWPKLEELHQRLFDSGFEGAHSAIADAEATMLCYQRLVQLNILSA